MTTEVKHAKITPEKLEEVRDQIGKRIPTRGQFNEYATIDTIRHFTYGIGDDNPLFSDEEYAAKTRWGTVIAPPTFYFTCQGSYPMGLPGVHGLFGGAEFEQHAPLKMGDKVVSSVHLSDVVEKKSQFADRTIIQTWTFEYENQRGEKLATAKRWTVRTERDTARAKGKYQAIEPHRYSAEELERIENEVLAEEIRGASPRYWEDVQEDELLQPVVKGPLTITDIIGWKIGWGFRPYVMPHRIGLHYRRKHPRLASPDQLGIPDVPERVHWDNEFAREIGAPAAYDYGPQRVTWLGQVVTNWMGDDGFLKLLRGEMRRFNIVGDTTWCRGKVSRKYVANGEHLVDLELWGENQRGEVTAPGRAVVVLPTRAT